MNIQKPNKHNSDEKRRSQFDLERKRADLLNKVVKLFIGGIIGMVLTSLFTIVVFAFVIKSFVAGDEVAYRLLNSAITMVGTVLGAAIGYFLGKSNDLKP